MDGLPPIDLALKGATQTTAGAPVSMSLGGDFIVNGNKRIWGITEKLLLAAAVAGGLVWMYRH